MLFDLHGSFNDFLQEQGKGNDEFPKNLNQLCAGGIKLVQADSNDPEGHRLINVCFVL